MRVLALFLLSVTIAACDLLTGPESGDYLYHYHDAYDTRIDRIDLRTGEVETVFDFDDHATWAFAVHGSALFAADMTVPGDAFRLHELDLCSMRLRWTLELGTREDPRILDGIAFGYLRSVSVSLDGTRLYLGEVFRNDSAGIVALDREGRQPVGFIALEAGGHTREVPPLAGHEDGVIVVNGLRTDEAPAGLYLFDPATFELLDSVAPSSVGLDHFWTVEPSVDGRTIYGSGIGDLYRYDLAQGALVARYTPDRWLGGGVAEAPDGSIVALDWPYYGREYPGSGLVYVFGPDLEPIGEVDVSTPVGGEPYTGTATHTNDVMIDGNTAYVLAMSVPGQLYDIQPARIFVIDLETLTLTKILELPDRRSVGRLFVPPEC